MQGNPRIGLILLRTDWTGRQEASSVIDSVQADLNEIVTRLGQHFQIIGPWVVESNETLAVCQQALREASLDLVLVAFQTWAEDARLVALLQFIGSNPLVVWCYQPWRRIPRPATFEDVLRGSGPVGTFGALGTLRNLDAPFLFTFGAPDDPRLVRDLQTAGRAAQVRRALRSARFGLLPTRNERMQVNFVDEFRLMTDIGPVVQYLSVSEYRRVTDSLARVRVDAYIDQVRRRFEVRNVSDETLVRGAQAALGLAHLALDNRLDVLALNDSASELQHVFGLRPGLYPDLLEPLQVIFQPEGDLGAAAANFILHHLTHSATMLLELWFWDEAKNQVVGGHGGMQNPVLAAPDQVWISPDREYQLSNAVEGAHFEFIARPGRVTLFQMRSTPHGWHAIAASGVCLEDRPWVQGFPHAILRLDAAIDRFLNQLANTGASQHWIMAYGSVLPELEAFCRILNIPLAVITY